MGRSGCPTKVKKGIGGSLCKPKSLGFLLLFDITPTKKSSSPSLSYQRPHMKKKMISLIALIQILPNILPAACIFSYPIMTYLKMLHGDMSLNTQQCPAGLSSRIIPQVSLLLQKMSPPSMFLGCTHQMLTVPPFHEPLWEILWMGKNPNQQLRIY